MGECVYISYISDILRKICYKCDYAVLCSGHICCCHARTIFKKVFETNTGCNRRFFDNNIRFSIGDFVNIHLALVSEPVVSLISAKHGIGPFEVIKVLDRKGAFHPQLVTIKVQGRAIYSLSGVMLCKTHMLP